MCACAYEYAKCTQQFFRLWLQFAYLFLWRLCSAESLLVCDCFCCSLLSRETRWQIPGPSASLSSRRSLRVDPLTVISCYIYVLGAERRLAVTCVREVVALMEFYTWQPSRQQWYVFKILSRNKTGFCYLPGQVGLFLSPVAPGGPGDSTGSR